MNTVIFSYLKTLCSIILIALLSSSCAQSNKNNADKAEIAAPNMDIQAAIISNNLEAVRQHIASGTDIDAKDAFSGSTPLITAITFGKTDIAKALIDAGADLSLKNNDGSTALHCAAFFCRVESLQMLIDANADKTLRNNYGATARETVLGPFGEIKPIYELMQQQLGPIGLQLDMDEIEKTRPVIAMMLQ